MSRTARVSVVDPKGGEVWIACAGTCRKETCHTVLTDVEESDATFDGDIQWWNSYKTVQCLGCKTVSYCHEHSNTEDFDHDEDGQMVAAVTRKLYPSRIAGRGEMDGSRELPHGLYRVYRETHSAISNNLAVLAGVGIRAIVEAVCNEKAAPGKNLQERIDSLVTLGLTTPDGAKILHSIRTMGNKAAHEAKANNAAELGVALDVIEHLLQGVYILPRRAATL